MEKAQKAYQQHYYLVEQAAILEPDNLYWQVNVSIALTQLGDALIEQGKLAEAQQHYQDGLVIMQKLTAQEPSNTKWQRDVSVS